MKLIIDKKIAGILCLFVVSILSFYTMEFFLRNPFEKMRLGAQVLNISFFLLAAFLLFFVTKSVRTAARIELAAACVIGLINYFVVQFRSNPVQPWDIFSIKTAAVVADNYKYTLGKNALICTAILAAAFVLSHFLPKTIHMSGKLRLGGSMVMLLLLVLLTNYTQSSDAVKRFHLYDKLFTPNTMTYKDGTVVAFVMQCQYLSVKEPKGYSEEKVQELLAQTKEHNAEDEEADTEKKYPNIIVVMNEAFSDLSLLGDYTVTETSEEMGRTEGKEVQTEIPFMKRLLSGEKNTISGYMDVSVLGGNTANTEFEYLTGDTMAFLPQGSIPYQQYVHAPIETMASSLHNLGYRTLALHPYRATGWERAEVYDYFGFDAFYTQEDFTDPKLYRKYISDEADVDKIIELYEQDTDTPLFLFNVTMQNHSSYTEQFDNFTPQLTVEGSESFALDQYLSLLRESDRALEKLVTYFENTDAPTLLVFFGDHQPTDSVVSPIYRLNGKKISELSDEELYHRYQVPYMIHANFDIEEAQNLPMSANYLGVKTLQTASLPLTDYQQFLAEQYEQFPSVSALQIQDAEGTLYSIDKKDELLNDYQILQYKHLFKNKE